MPKIEISLTTPVVRTARAMQLEGLFDVPPSERSERVWAVNTPGLEEPWQIGLIVGASGSGKSTLARQAFGQYLVDCYDWPADKCVVDGFSTDLSVKDITAALSSVGFSSPPSWLRPFRCLSNGEQFRATLARALCDPRPVVAVDEFTSVVDRTVARIGSAAVAKAIRRQPGKRFVAVTCHHDVVEWLCPDWIIEMPEGKLTRGSLRRPSIELEIKRVHHSAWELFKHHHYLDTNLNKSAVCFAAFIKSQPVAFASVITAFGIANMLREHRTVCLPDFQGVGIGNAVSNFVAKVMKGRGYVYSSTTSNPAMIRHRLQSPLWRMHKAPGLNKQDGGERHRYQNRMKRASNRLTAGFRYVGPGDRSLALSYGLSLAPSTR